MPAHPDTEAFLRDAIARIALAALALPDAYEEDAWVGVRWRIRKRTFAHAIPIESAESWRPVERPRSAPEPLGVLTFRSRGEELEALVGSGYPYYKLHWSPTATGAYLTRATDWDEIAELVTESYCLMAPKSLAARVRRPEQPG